MTDSSHSTLLQHFICEKELTLVVQFDLDEVVVIRRTVANSTQDMILSHIEPLFERLWQLNECKSNVHFPFSSDLVSTTSNGNMWLCCSASGQWALRTFSVCQCLCTTTN